MNNNKDNIMKRILIDVFLAYLISSVVLIIAKTYFSYQNGEELVETIMLNFRTYFLGSITTEEKIFAMNMDSIGLFAIHLTIFFAMLIYCVICSEGFGKTKNLIISIAIILIGIVLTIFMRERFIWCLPEALLLSGIILLVLTIIGANYLVGDKSANQAKARKAKSSDNVSDKLYKPVVLAIRIALVIFSFISIVVTLLPYVVEEI